MQQRNAWIKDKKKFAEDAKRLSKINKFLARFCSFTFLLHNYVATLENVKILQALPRRPDCLNQKCANRLRTPSQLAIFGLPGRNVSI
jgi:uncharacterized protein YutD